MRHTARERSKAAKPAKEGHRRTRLAPDQRRQALLVSVEKVVARKGYQGATVPDVVAAAGVAQGCFYRYFRNIDDAFLAAIQRLLARLERAATDLDFSDVRRASDLERELIGYFLALGHLIAEHTALLSEALLVAPAARGRVGRATSAFLERMHTVARDLLRRHAGRPPFRALDADVAAAAVVGMVLGGAREAVRLGRTYDAERWAAEMARFETGALTGPSHERANQRSNERRSTSERKPRRPLKNPGPSRRPRFAPSARRETAGIVVLCRGFATQRSARGSVAGDGSGFFNGLLAPAPAREVRDE